MISFFLVGPRTTLEKEIEQIVRDFENRNPSYEADIEILNKTTEGCAEGTTKYTYKLRTALRDY